jgi:hypothetical protein
LMDMAVMTRRFSGHRRKLCRSVCKSGHDLTFVGEINGPIRRDDTHQRPHRAFG